MRFDVGSTCAIVLVVVLVLDAPVSRTRDEDEDDYSGKTRLICAMHP